MKGACGFHLGCLHCKLKPAISITDSLYVGQTIKLYQYSEHVQAVLFMGMCSKINKKNLRQTYK